MKLTHDQRRRRAKARVLADANHTCHYCGGTADTVDHVVPRSRGGTHDRANLVASCEPCNQAKGDTDYVLFCAAMLADQWCKQ